jgi:hypothetical protein
MKKLFFSAVALVAFSSVSMAGTTHKIKEIKIVEKIAMCDAVFNSVYIYARNQGYNDQQANVIAFAAYDKCLGCESTKCSTKQLTTN